MHRFRECKSGPAELVFATGAADEGAAGVLAGEAGGSGAAAVWLVGGDALETGTALCLLQPETRISANEPSARPGIHPRADR